MKNTFVSLLTVFLCVAIAGCKQDPLDGYPDSVKGAKPPGTKPTDRTSSESLIIDVNDFYEVKEGENLDFQITGRVVIPNLGHEIVIENLAEFPGATFDQATGDFAWKPSLDFVKTGEKILVNLKVLMLTTGSKQLLRRKDVAILVLRQFVGPEVTTANSLQEMIEGQMDEFSVTVKSPEESTAPSLSVVLNRSGVQDGAVFVSLDRNVAVNPVRSTIDPALWTFYMKIELGDSEITDASADLYFGLQAISSYGLSSAVKSFSYTVKTSYAAPRSTWLSEQTFTAGQETNFQYLIFDAKEEGRVSANIMNCAALTGAVCNCAGVGRSQTQCTIRWKPASSMAGKSFVINTEAKNASPIPNDPRNQAKNLSGTLKVVTP